MSRAVVTITDVETVLLSHVYPEDVTLEWSAGWIESWDASLVRVETDTGLVGWGEAGHALTGQRPDPGPVSVLVDYAHTHDALENVLLALGPVTRGALIVVFGCGGDRDRAKRPKMAEVAGRLADRCYVTSDNPRTEDPKQIIREIMAGFPAPARQRTTAIEDRAEAIATAIAQASPGDTVLIAGKGHEAYQIVGQTRRPFDDREHAAAALAHDGRRAAV